MTAQPRTTGSNILIAAAFALTALCTQNASASEKVLYSFKGGSDGRIPDSAMIMDNFGNLFGTTAEGGGGTNCTEGNIYGCGTVFKLEGDGTELMLHGFAGGCDGAVPLGGVISDGQGNLFGTTRSGGCNGYGTLFQIAPDGTESILYAFQGGNDGSLPMSGLFRAKDGNLYGTTLVGGNGANCTGGCGTVFEVTSSGGHKVVYNFQDANDGAEPIAGVIMDNSGDIFGTTWVGSDACSCGSVYEISPDGTETTLHQFQGGSDGAYPESTLIEDKAGNLYGTTGGGGSSNDGTVFKVTAGGDESVLYSFKGGADGEIPLAGVIMDAAGNLYGTTNTGGNGRCKDRGCGIAYKLTPSGQEIILEVFGGRAGRSPDAGLLLKNKLLYGTTGGGGAQNQGVVFSLRK